MSVREDLKACIDQLPEGSLEHAGAILRHLINPPPPLPEVGRIKERSQEYRRLVEQRFRETRKPGTIGGMGGSGFASMREGRPFGRRSFHYRDGNALVYQSLLSFDGQEIEIMERLSFSANRTKFICALEITSSDRTVQIEETFPIIPTDKA
jgi:hypothetical protein